MLNSREKLEMFLKKEMPGNWTKKHVTNLSACLPEIGDKFYKSPERTECVETKKEEVEELCNFLHFEYLNEKKEPITILEPFNGTGTISKYLKTKYENINVVTNDICEKHGGNNDYNENSLNIDLYKKIENIDVIITSPWFAILDIAIPVILKQVKLFAAIHVPAHYITNAHENRITYLKKLARRRRIRILNNSHSSSIGWKCVWLLIFKDARTANTYIKKNDVIPYYFL